MRSCYFFIFLETGTLGGGQRIYGHCYTILVPLPNQEYHVLKNSSTDHIPIDTRARETEQNNFPKILYEPICFCMVSIYKRKRASIA